MVQLLFHKGADPEDRKQNSLNWKTDGFEVVSRIEKLPPIFLHSTKKDGMDFDVSSRFFFATQLQGTKHNINQPYNKNHSLLTSKLGKNLGVSYLYKIRFVVYNCLRNASYAGNVQ